MVQRKVANYKLGIQAYDKTLKTEKKQNTIKPSLQNNHDGYMSKGADSKAIKMKKSCSIKRSDVEISLSPSPKSGYEAPRQPGKPPTLVTPRPKRPSSCKSSYTSPNYMRSTSSFEARKEKTPQVRSISSSSKVHKVAKTLSKTYSFKKVRTLSKAPSFRHCTRTTTCSSTLKDAKFPPSLELKPGATEAQGRSVLRVCSYKHCSLNGDHHNPAPPLKRFMSSRRRLLKTQKVSRPGVLSPRQEKLSKYKESGVGDQNEEFFVEIYVPERGVDAQVSENLSDGPCSEIDFQDDLDQSEDTNLSHLNFCLKEEDYSPTPVQSDLEVESSPSVSLDEFSCENSDIEWEEEQHCSVNDNGEVKVQRDYNNDQDKPGFETDNSVDGYLEEFLEYPPYFHDEIVEYLCFSDADSLPDSESTQTGEKDIEEPYKVEEKDEMNSGPKNEVAEEDSTLSAKATIHASELEDESANKQGGIISNLTEEITDVQNEDLESFQEPVELDGDKSNEENYIIGETREENPVAVVMEERGPIDNLENSGAEDGTCMASNNDRDGIDQSEAIAAFARQKAIEAEADDYVSTRSANSEDENYTSELKHDSNENSVVGVETLGEINKTETTKTISNYRETVADQELLDSSNQLKRGMRCKKADEDVEKEREFNPRGPNFLDVEPDPEAEKVDLRHQEIDDRRNAEEWMLDHALQKTVNQLAPARKRKVALLVEAFEAVLPVSKDESSTRRDSLGFDHERPIQACS